jgi:hypothetical protein
MSIKMKIKVTKEILRKSMWCGTPSGSSDVVSNCAIALAVRDIFPNASVGIYTMSFGLNTDSIELPSVAKKFIECFDQLRLKPYKRLLLQEIEFEIQIPNEVISRIGNGNIEEVKTIIQNSETLELV